nr:unnamed protein product [Callosobruchus chinensis]
MSRVIRGLSSVTCTVNAKKQRCGRSAILDAGQSPEPPDKGSAGRQLKLRNTSSSIVLPCAEEEARIRKLSRRREGR